MKRKISVAALAPYAILMLVSFFIASQSATAPMYNIEKGADASVFAYIGWMMTQGAVPYIDVWDNKGPLLYFIQFIGVLIHQRHGIFVMECLAIFVSAIFMYKTARLFAGRAVSTAASVFCVLLTALFLEGGNLSEEFALPFICAALYLLTKFVFQENRLKWHQTMLIGACAAACALIRINLMAPILATCAVLFLYSLILKKWKNVLLLVVNFAAGFAAFVLPFALYLWSHQALKACISAAYTMLLKDNLYLPIKRVENMYGILSSSNISYAFILMLAFTACLIVFLFVGRKEQNRYKVIGVCAVVAFALNVAANMISGAPYLHYFLSCIPLLLFPAMCGMKFLYRLVYQAFSQESASHYRPYAAFLASCAVAFVLIFSSWGSINNNVQKILANAQYKDRDVASLVSIIQRNSASEDTIVCYGDFQPVIIKSSYRKSATRFFYPPVWNAFDDTFIAEVKAEIAADIREHKPALILIKEGMGSGLYKSDAALEPFINENYELLPGKVPLQYVIYKRK